MKAILFDLDNTLYGADRALFNLIDVSSRLSENKPLRIVLKNLPQRKFVFTNGSLCHAQRVLNCLKIEDCFEDVFDIRVSDYIPKPHRSPYDAVLAATGLTGAECVMVEDCIENLHTASALGMKTTLVSDQETQHDVDAVVRCAEEVCSVIQDWMI